jgi:hypothetical protein
MSETILQRRFCVRSAAETAARARLVEGLSFEDAALRFVEDFHPAVDEEGEVCLYVEDSETGEEQCFTIDLATGEAQPCD